MEIINNCLKCIDCKNILDLPVMLPCGDSVCKKHVEPNAREYHCLECDEIHLIPKEGFRENKVLVKLINTDLAKAKFCPEYENAFYSFKNLEKVFEEMQHFEKDPINFINEPISELKRKTDLLRDEFKLKIDEKANELINELEEYDKECQMNLNSVDVSEKLKELAANIKIIKEKLEEYQNVLSHFGSNQSDWMIIKDESERYSNDLKMKLNEYKEQFLLKKLATYRFKIFAFTTVSLQSDRK